MVLSKQQRVLHRNSYLWAIGMFYKFHEYIFNVVLLLQIVWKINNRKMIEARQFVIDRPLNLHGDARFDSPGHTALHGWYSVMDAETSLIVSCHVIKVSHSRKCLVILVSYDNNFCIAMILFKTTCFSIFFQHFYCMNFYRVRKLAHLKRWNWKVWLGAEKKLSLLDWQ